MSKDVKEEEVKDKAVEASVGVANSPNKPAPGSALAQEQEYKSLSIQTWIDVMDNGYLVRCATARPYGEPALEKFVFNDKELAKLKVLELMNTAVGKMPCICATDGCESISA